MASSFARLSARAALSGSRLAGAHGGTRLLSSPPALILRRRAMPSRHKTGGKAKHKHGPRRTSQVAKQKSSAAAVGRRLTKGQVGMGAGGSRQSTAFEKLGVPPFLAARLPFAKPSLVQTAAIPDLMRPWDKAKGRYQPRVPSVIVQDLTGSGKTLSYLLPVLSNIDKSQAALQAIIVVPTRELAVQVAKVATELASRGHASKGRRDVVIRTALNGDNAVLTPVRPVMAGSSGTTSSVPPHLLIGTPAAVNSLVLGKAAPQFDDMGFPSAAAAAAGGMDTSHLQYLVLDEADFLLSRRSTVHDLYDLVGLLPVPEAATASATATTSQGGTEQKASSSPFLSFDDSEGFESEDFASEDLENWEQALKSQDAATALPPNPHTAALVSSAGQEQETGRAPSQLVLVSATISSHVHDFLEQSQRGSIIDATADSEGKDKDKDKDTTTILPLVKVVGRTKHALPNGLRNLVMTHPAQPMRTMLSRRVELLANVLKSLTRLDRGNLARERATKAWGTVLVFFNDWNQVEELDVLGALQKKGINVGTLSPHSTRAERGRALRVPMPSEDAKSAGHSRDGTPRAIQNADTFQGYDVLLTSDLMSRGMDIKGLSHVVNFETPLSPTVYLHRAGRVGRMLGSTPEHMLPPGERGQRARGSVLTLISTARDASILGKAAKRWGFTPRAAKLTETMRRDQPKLSLQIEEP